MVLSEHRLVVSRLGELVIGEGDGFLLCPRGGEVPADWVDRYYALTTKRIEGPESTKEEVVILKTKKRRGS